jgi:hypothetical protein
MNEEVRYWIQRFREGDQEGAFFGLLEMAATADLVGLFQLTTERDLRRFLAHTIRNMNDPAAVSFFEEAVYDADPEVSKEGMDGLVSLATQSSLEILEAAKNRQFGDQNDTLRFREWVEEAIEQAKETMESRQDQANASPVPRCNRT